MSLEIYKDTEFYLGGLPILTKTENSCKILCSSDIYDVYRILKRTSNVGICAFPIFEAKL